MLYQSTPTHISYKKDSTGLIEEKFILPTRVPSDLITALDISDLSESEIDNLTQLQRDYSSYIKSVFEQAFKFEDWVEHTTGERPTVKWRSYKVANILKSD